MMKERLRKSIVRAVFIFLWGWLMHYFYIEEGQIDIFKMCLLIGFPFGIYKIHLWVLPKNLDIGGTVGVWTMNIIIGGIMGGFVVIGYILRLLYDVFTVMVERVW